MFRSRKGLASLATCLLVCQCLNQESPLIQAYSITSQYLGATPSNGNEHLLLFKLPETISSQLLEQSNFAGQQRNQQIVSKEPRLIVQSNGPAPLMIPQQQQQQIPYYQQAALSQLSAPQLPRYEAQSSASSVIQEQPVSLTIPLSALHSIDHRPVTASTNQVSRPTYQEASNQVVRTKQVALESALADYINSAASHLPQQADSISAGASAQQDYQASLTDMGSSSLSAASRLLRGVNQNVFISPRGVQQQFVANRQQVILDPVAPLNQEPAIQAKNHSNLQSSNESQLDSLKLNQLERLHAELQQQLQQQQLQQDAQPQPQPSLWRDLQPTRQYNPQQPINANHSDMASMLARLSSSSPDLLVRLRNLLKRASNIQQTGGNTVGTMLTVPQLDGSLNSTATLSNLRPFDHVPKQADLEAGNNELLMANNIAPSEFKSMIQNYLMNQRQNARATDQGSTGAEQSSLGAFLSSQNVSSHEEIKIPLIVIAMPRIVSLKRNQMAATNSQQRSAYNSSLPAIASDLAQTIARSQLPQLLNANLSHPQTHQSNHSANMTGNQILWLDQQVHTTTSMPIHTMAPYAQQFVMPRLASAPLIRTDLAPLHQVNQRHQQQHHHHQGQQQQLPSAYYPSQDKAAYLTVIANQSDYLTGNNQGASHFRPLVDTMIVGRPQLNQAAFQNSTSTQLQHSLADGGHANMQIQLIAQPTNAGSNLEAAHQMQPESNGTHQRAVQLQYASSGHSSPYEIQQELDLSPESGQQQIQRQLQPQQHQQQQVVYLNPIGQQRTVRLTNNNFTADEAMSNSIEPRAKALYSDLQQQMVRRQQSGADSPISSRLSLVEEQLGRLRPLIQQNRRPSSHLSANQMLTLLSRSGERRMSNDVELDQQTNDELQNGSMELNNPLTANVSNQPKKSAKMVVMIV